MADATLVRRRRGTEAQCESGTPAEGEIWIDLTNDTTRVGDGVRQGGFIQPNAFHLQNEKFTFAQTGGTANALSFVLSPLPSGYSQPFSFKFKAIASNTGAVTAQIPPYSVVDVYKMSGTASVPLTGGEIIVGGFYVLNYDGSRFIIENVTASQNITPGDYIVGAVRPYSYSRTTGVEFNIGSSPSSPWSWVELFALNSPFTGSIKANFSFKYTSFSTGPFQARWYINETPIGLVRTATTAFVNYAENITISAGDRISLRFNSPNAQAQTEFTSIYVGTNEFVPAFPLLSLFSVT